MNEENKITNVKLELEQNICLCQRMADDCIRRIALFNRLRFWSLLCLCGIASVYLESLWYFGHAKVFYFNIPIAVAIIILVQLDVERGIRYQRKRKRIYAAQKIVFRDMLQQWQGY